MNLTRRQTAVAALMMLIVFGAGVTLGYRLHQVVFERQVEEVAELKEFFEDGIQSLMGKNGRVPAIKDAIPNLNQEGKLSSRKI